MKVHPIDREFWRFHVDSSIAGHPPYFVDLEEHDCNGGCDCPDFRTRKAALLKQFGNWPRRRCKHIIAARDFALDRDIKMQQQAEMRALPKQKGQR